VRDPVTIWDYNSRMHPVTLFSLATHEGPYEKWPLKTQLFADGVDTRQTVSGFVIEAQYRCSAGYLLITSYDCLFEESNAFLLLNDQYETIARKVLGTMYATFLLEKHTPLSDTQLELDYGDGLRYRLAIEPRFLGGLKLKLTKMDNAVA
jgi:hypothetical protein